MPDTGFLFLSLMGVLLGSILVLYPDGLMQIGNALNRTMTALDRWFVRYRYMTALLAFLGSYAFFRIALLLPGMR